MDRIDTQARESKPAVAQETAALQTPTTPITQLKDGTYDGVYFNKDGFVDYAPGDPDFPQNWPLLRRIYVTSSVVFLVFNATFASSAISGCLPSVIKRFHVSPVVSGLTVTVFLLGYCAGPLFFAPLSEIYGRRWIFYSTFSLYFAFNFLCAWAPNYAALLIGRAITGTLVSAPLSNAPGVIADVWNPIERGTAMAGFAASVWCGSALGPVVGGFLQLKKDWQWVFFVQIWLAAGSLFLMPLIPETHAPTILRHKAKKLRQSDNPLFKDVKAPADATDRRLGPALKIAVTRPFVILFDPISFACAIYLSVIYTLLYMLFAIYPFIFGRKRGWNAGVSKLPLLGTIVGCFLGAGLIVWETQRRGKKIKAGLVKPSDFTAEDRLPLAMGGGVGFAIFMFTFACTKLDSLDRSHHRRRLPFVLSSSRLCCFPQLHCRQLYAVRSLSHRSQHHYAISLRLCGAPVYTANVRCTRRRRRRKHHRCGCGGLGRDTLPLLQVRQGHQGTKQVLAEQGHGGQEAA